MRTEQADQVYVVGRGLAVLASQRLSGRANGIHWSGSTLEIVEEQGLWELDVDGLELHKIQVVSRFDPRTNRIEQRAVLKTPRVGSPTLIATEWSGSRWRQIWFTNFAREAEQSVYVSVDEAGEEKQVASARLQPASSIPGYPYKRLYELRSPSRGILFREPLRVELGGDAELWPGSKIAVNGSADAWKCVRSFVLREHGPEPVDDCSKRPRIPVANGRRIELSPSLRRVSFGAGESVWLTRDVTSSLVLSGG